MKVVRTHAVDCDCGHTIIFYGDELDVESDELRSSAAFVDDMNDWASRLGRPVLRVAAAAVTSVACPGCGREHAAPVPELLDPDRGGGPFFE